MKKLYLYLFFILVILCSNICYATPVTVTDENLKESLQKYVSSEANDENYNITVSNNVITITVDNESFTLNYDLTDKPTFSFEIPIEKGMSYDEFNEQTENLMLPWVGYVAVANIQGVAFEDGMAYILMSYLGNAFNGSWSNENSYVIFDDTNMSEGVTIDRDESDKKTIYVSEFGERVMEYVNATYKDKQTITDAENGINSYEWIIEKRDVTETSCKLVSSLTVNADADFSKIEGYAAQLGESFMDKDITKDNADYSITLKVGQKCRFKTTEKITGHGISGSGCSFEEINENCVEITGTSVGKANGYIYVGENKKTIYITVEENTNNDTLETITYNVESSSKNSVTNTEEIKQENEKDTSIDNTVKYSKLPQTGSNNTILFIIIALIAIAILIKICLKKYNDIR